MRHHRQIEQELVRFFSEKPKIIIAVSGGIDSVVLSHALAEYYAEEKCEKLILAHYDHSLRVTSIEDAHFVTAYADELGITCIQEKRDGRENFGNVEAEMRRLRYRFLEDLRVSTDAAHIVTAHHASDVAETFLMKLLGGRELRTIESVSRNATVIRPLLRISKPQILSYAAKYSLTHCTDPTNADQSLLRNWIRLTVLPLLRQREKNVEELISEMAFFTEDESLYLRNSMKGLYQEKLAHLTWGSRDWVHALKKELVTLKNHTAEVRLTQESLLHAPDQNWLKPGQSSPGLLLSQRVMEVYLAKRVACDLEGCYELRRSAGAVSIVLKNQ